MPQTYIHLIFINHCPTCPLLHDVQILLPLPLTVSKFTLDPLLKTCLKLREACKPLYFIQQPLPFPLLFSLLVSVITAPALRVSPPAAEQSKICKV